MKKKCLTCIYGEERKIIIPQKFYGSFQEKNSYDDVEYEERMWCSDKKKFVTKDEIKECKLKSYYRSFEK